MKRNDTLRLGEALSAFFHTEEPDMHEELLGRRAVETFRQLLGSSSLYVTSAVVRDAVLYVSVSAAPLRQSLMLERDRLLKQINTTIQAELLREIVVR